MTLMLLFLALQGVPLTASDQPYQGPTVKPQYNDPGGGAGGGDEHPWQDNDNDQDIDGFSKSIKNLVSLVFDFFNGKKKISKSDYRPNVKTKGKTESKFSRRFWTK